MEAQPAPSRRQGIDVSATARRAGLARTVPTRADIDHRRAQLLGTLLFVVLALGLSLTAMSVQTSDESIRDLIVRQPGFRYGLIAALVAFGAYVFDTERALRRLAVAISEAETSVTTHQAKVQWLATLDHVKSASVTAIDAALSRQLSTISDLVAELETDDALSRTLAFEVRVAESELQRIIQDHDASIVELSRVEPTAAITT